MRDSSTGPFSEHSSDPKNPTLWLGRVYSPDFPHYSTPIRSAVAMPDVAHFFPVGRNSNDAEFMQ